MCKPLEISVLQNFNSMGQPPTKEQPKRLIVNHDTWKKRGSGGSFLPFLLEGVWEWGWIGLSG